MENLMMKYFVLNPNKDDVFGNASRRAIFEYAKIIESEHPEFAKDLRIWMNKIEGNQSS